MTALNHPMERTQVTGTFNIWREVVCARTIQITKGLPSYWGIDEETFRGVEKTAPFI